MNLITPGLYDEQNIKIKTFEKTVDQKLNDLGWRGPTRTQGRKGKTSCKVITYEKKGLQVELTFVFDEETVNIRSYIFVSKPDRGVSLEEMRLFIVKMEDELK